MKKLIFIFCAALCFVLKSFSQDTILSKTLDSVVVRGYEQNRSLIETAAPVSVVNQQQLQRFGNLSVLPAINNVPGVRMEERSPGSYRLSIRGSSLRSPFGVRNVKIYLNGIPFTDPGGNTYLNQLSFYNFSFIEILKGPGSSLYGAGMGGVMLIKSTPDIINNQVSANYSGGSFNTQNINISASAGNESSQNTISYTHQASDGYRQQSAMRRDIVMWDSKISVNKKQSLSAHVLFGDLFYQTPGALTFSEYSANPKAARPAAGGFPSAVQNKAAIYQKMFWAGVEHQYNFSDHFKNSTSVYGAFTQFKNPAIRNYERRLEPNFGGRTTFSYSNQGNKTKLSAVAGAEYQQGYTTDKVYKTKRGTPDSLQTDDEINNHIATLYAQGEISFANGWIATAGASLNTSFTEFNRLSVVPLFIYKTNFSNEVVPRVSILKKITKNLSLYGLVAKGFSPPTVAELLPTTSVINTNLQAEKGMNYEAGFRGNILRNHLSIDINAYTSGLQNSISQRSDSSGASYFINAGTTRQKGIEAAFNFLITRNAGQFITFSNISLSYAYQNFRYKQFKQLTTDYSNNKIPGVAPNTLSAGFTINTKPGFYLYANYFFSDKIALSDANVAFANAYHLLGGKVGYKKLFQRHFLANIFLGGDNMLNEKYSLGNDINAAASRYYNAAPGANYFAGFSFQYNFNSSKSL